MAKKPITLPWMDKIRERLEEVKPNLTLVRWHAVNEFLQPIIDYGKSQEARINRKFSNRNIAKQIEEEVK